MKPRHTLGFGAFAAVMMAVCGLSANATSLPPQTWLPPQSGLPWMTEENQKAITNIREDLVGILSCAEDCQTNEAFLLAQAPHHQIRFVKVHAGEESGFPNPGLFIFDRGKMILRARGFDGGKSGAAEAFYAYATAVEAAHNSSKEAVTELARLSAKEDTVQSDYDNWIDTIKADLAADSKVQKQLASLKAQLTKLAAPFYKKLTTIELRFSKLQRSLGQTPAKTAAVDKKLNLLRAKYHKIEQREEKALASVNSQIVDAMAEYQARADAAVVTANAAFDDLEPKIAAARAKYHDAVAPFQPAIDKATIAFLSATTVQQNKH